MSFSLRKDKFNDEEIMEDIVKDDVDAFGYRRGIFITKVKPILPHKDFKKQ